MMDISLLFKASVCSRFKDNLISLRALHSERFSFSLEGDFMKVSKEDHLKLQAERVSNVYML